MILLAFGLQGQQTTVNGQQTLCTGGQQTTVNGQQTSCTSDAYTRTVDCCPLTVDYYENQIRKADSLYKNYLPQSNFEEVKAAMEFFDSLRLSKTTDNGQQTTDFVQWWTTVNSQQTTDIFHRSKTKSCTSDAYSRTVDCCPLSVDFICAKAHYYHAVGLTEKDDIVGACEHYLIALEIMEPLVETHRRASNNRRAISVDNPEDYEKIRFISLTYTRLGQMFYNESYCNIAISNYQKALHYTNILENDLSIAQTLKNIGNSYLLQNNADSALYYYNKSLKTSNDIGNKLDVEKCIAQILYYDKNEHDSAFVILKNNLNKITNEDVKYSYHCLIGNLYFNDQSYDSALYYLEESLVDSIRNKKIAFTTSLSAIYDSLGNYEKKAYYDNLSSKLFFNNINKEVDKSKLQVIYENYKERKAENENAIAMTKTRNTTITISFIVIVVVISALTYIRYNHRKVHDELKKEIDIRTKDIECKNSIINQKEKLINEYQITNENKNMIIDKQKKEIDRIKTKLNKKNVNLEAYYASDICKKIIERKDSDFSCLKEDELALLLKSADEHLDNISERLHNSFSRLNKNDIYTICLIILNVEKGKLQYLLGKDRKTIWNRLNKIKRLMNVDENHDLFLYIKNNFLK